MEIFIHLRIQIFCGYLLFVNLFIGLRNLAYSVPIIWLELLTLQLMTFHTNAEAELLKRILKTVDELVVSEIRWKTIVV